MNKLKFLFYLLPICILFIASGCAQTLRVESIKPGLSVSKTNKLPDNTRVAIATFKVNAKDQTENIIGEAKVGLVNSKADIVSTENVSSIVANAVKRGFSETGFSVVDSRDADFVISGTVERFWVDEYATGLSLEYSKASVKYDLLIKNKQAAIVWANTIDVFKTSDKSMDTTENDIPMLSLALKESVEAIFRDQTFWSALSK